MFAKHCNIIKTSLILRWSKTYFFFANNGPQLHPFHALNMQFIIKKKHNWSGTIWVCDYHCSRDSILYMLPFKCYAKDSVKVPLFCIKEQMCLSLCLKQLRNLWCQRNLWSQTKRSELFVRPSVQLLYWVRFSKVYTLHRNQSHSSRCCAVHWLLAQGLCLSLRIRHTAIAKKFLEKCMIQPLVQKFP